MANYNVLIKPSAVKELERIPKKQLQKIAEKIQALALDPRPSGCEKVAERNTYRIRQSSYRIVYTIEDDHLVMLVIKIGHRRDIYR